MLAITSLVPNYPRLIFLTLVVLVLLPARSRMAGAATITVDTLVDELDTNSLCSLREAVQAASSNMPVSGCAAGSTSGADTINLPAGLFVLSRVGAASSVPRLAATSVRSSWQARRRLRGRCSL